MARIRKKATPSTTPQVGQTHHSLLGFTRSCLLIMIGVFAGIFVTELDVYQEYRPAFLLDFDSNPPQPHGKETWAQTPPRTPELPGSSSSSASTSAAEQTLAQPPTTSPLSSSQQQLDAGCPKCPGQTLGRVIPVEQRDLETYLYGHPRPSYHMFYNEEYKFVYCAIPKVGCTEWIQLFLRMQGDPEWRKSPHFNPRRKYFADLPLDRATAIMNDPSWTKAVFLRDPAERLLSAWLDKFAAGGSTSYPVRVFNKNHTYPFSELVAHVIQGGPYPDGLSLRTDAHWRPQHYHCALHKFLPKYQFVGHIDYMAEHAEQLLKALGIWDKYGASGWGENGDKPFLQEINRYHRKGAKDAFNKYYQIQVGSAKRRALLQSANATGNLRQQQLVQRLKSKRTVVNLDDGDSPLLRDVHNAYFMDYDMMTALGVGGPLPASGCLC